MARSSIYCVSDFLSQLKFRKTTMKLVTAFLIISMSLRFTKCDERPLVHTGLGLLRGTWLTSEQGRSYAAFMTVPFAKPPVGPLRFEPPVPMEPWDGEWDAGQPAPTCMAYSHMLNPRDKRRIKGQEDCLYLNVYAPRLPSSEQNISLPVILYLHGGAFMYGGGTFWGAKFMMDRDVLFVTINYRLGPLGFLSLGDDVVPGNNGMRDQVEAFRWIHNHISGFGGDPGRVTLLGHSAGGASAHYHYISPLSRGLFQRGISLSGTALCRWALADKAREKALQLAASVGCPTNEGSRRLLNCLKSRPADRILMNVGQFQMWQYTPFSPFAPVVERQQTPPPFLPEAPASALARGAMLRAPWITGIVTEEGLYPTAEFINKPVELQRLNREFELLVPHLLDFNWTVVHEQQHEVASRVREEYFGQQAVNEDTVPNIVKMVSDRLFVVDAQRAAELQASFSPVYFYKFNFKGELSLTDIMTETKKDFGVAHSDDITFYLNASFIPWDVVHTGIEKQLEILLLDLWSSFATDGVPEAADAPTWSPVTPGGELEYLYIPSVPPVMAQEADLGNAAFWESLPILESEQSLVFHNNSLFND